MKASMLLALLFISSVISAQIRVIKLNTLSASLGGASLAYEQVKKKQYSFQLGLNYRPNINGPAWIYARPNDDYDLNASKSNWLGGHAEYRFYTKKAKKLATKPYISLYGRYLLHEITLEESGPGVDQEIATHTIKQETQSIGVGLQYGVQWVFNKRWSVDWTMIGFGINLNRLDVNLAGSENLSVGRLEEALSSIPLFGSQYLFKKSEDTFQIDKQFVGVSPRMALRVGLLF